MDATELVILPPGDILQAGQLPPDRKAILMFLANRKAKTREAYELDLKMYWQWCQAFPVPPLLVERWHVQLYLEHLQKRGLADATVARRFGTAKLFLRMCYEEDLIPNDPTKRLKTPKIDRDRQYRTWFTTVDMATVLKKAYSRPRDYALLFFMSATAMRVGEVLALNVTNIHRDPGRVWVGFTGKGDKYAEINLTYATLTALDRYLAGRTEGPLFLNHAGVRMRRTQVQDVIDKASLEAEVDYRVTPHGVRRTHAETAAEQGSDILGISESLRHKDSRVTRQCYLKNAGNRGGQTQQKVSDVYANMAG